MPLNTLPAYCKVTATEASDAATVNTGLLEKKYGDGYERVMKTNQINNLKTTLSITLAPLTDTQVQSLQTFIDNNPVFSWTHPLYKSTQWSCETISIKGVRNTANVSLSITSRYGNYG